MATPNGVTLRLAKRSDIPEISRISNAANSKSALHKRQVPNQDRYPADFYRWRLNTVRMRLTNSKQRTIVAEDSKGRIIGLCTWGVEGTDAHLYKEWSSQGTWADWLDARLIRAEQFYHQWFIDRSVDYKYTSFLSTLLQRADYAARPANLHANIIVIDPATQSKGVGRMLIDWGKKLAMKEDLPIFLESNLEATGFYEKTGFSRMSPDVVVEFPGEETVRIPMYTWEGKGREGRWLERADNWTGDGERWKWRADVLPKK